MPESAAPSQNPAITLPRPSVNGSSSSQPASSQSASSQPASSQSVPAPHAPPPRPRQRPSRIASIRIALIAGFGALILLVIFIAQNTRATRVSFMGAHASMSLALALLIAAIAGALLMAAAGTARITQLRLTMRRLARRPGHGGG